MENQRIQLLLEKYREGTCTNEELAELDVWYRELDADSKERLPESIYENAGTFLTERYRSFEKRVQPERKVITVRQWLKYGIAAVIVMGLGFAVFWKYQTRQADKMQIAVNDVAPGRNGAVLTLADGRKVVLDSSSNGQIAVEGNTVVKNGQGQLSYKTDNREAVSISYNTLTTPPARQYKIILPDGTKVWLNAASAITYPTAFTGSERKVTVTGEAYFEVVHDAARPFKVAIGKTEITDIGTHFDVFAYRDEPALKATLLEGAIKVNNHLLKPGEQASISSDEKMKITRLPDVTDAIAWKKGEISFDNVDVATLMRQLARWYNIEIVYKDKVPHWHLLGTISRQTNLSNVIAVLNANDIHCHIEGRKLVVGL